MYIYVFLFHGQFTCLLANIPESISKISNFPINYKLQLINIWSNFHLIVNPLIEIYSDTTKTVSMGKSKRAHSNRRLLWK